MINIPDRKEKVGLVLEGGGMRGIYTAGVLDEFMKNNIAADGVVGVSAGSIHGTSYISEQFGRSIRYYMKYRNDKRFMSAYSLITTGDICGKEFCYETIPNELDKFDYAAFKENAARIPIYATVTSLETGEAEYLRLFDLKEDMDKLRASASMPLVSNTVMINDKGYLDGGSADSIPIMFMRKNGYKKNIIVLTQPEDYEKKPDKTMPLMKRRYKDYPEYLETCENRYIMYNKTLRYIEYLEKKGEVLVIKPSRDLHVKRTEKNIDNIKRLYKLGRYDARNIMESLKDFIK